MKDAADAAAQPFQRLAVEAAHRTPVHHDLPFIGLDEAVDGTQQGGLAAAAGPHHRHRLPFPDVQIDAFQHFHGSKPLAQAFNAHHRRPDPLSHGLAGG